MVSWIKQFAVQQAAKKILSNLHRFSKENLIRLTFLAEKVITQYDPLVVKAIREAREYFLPIEILDKVITEAKNEMGMHFIVTQGGEMFVYNDMWKLYEKHNDIYFQVYTNGTLINKEVARRLSRLGNVASMISLEGFREQTDARRGKGVFDKVMQAMDNSREAGVLFGFSVTQTRENTEVVTFFEFIDMPIEKGCYIGWYFQFLPIGKEISV